MKWMIIWIFSINLNNIELGYEIKETKTGSLFSHKFEILYFLPLKLHGFGISCEFWDEGGKEWWRFLVPPKENSYCGWYHTHFSLFFHKSFYFFRSLKIQFKTGIGKWEYKLYENYNNDYNFILGHVFTISSSCGIGFCPPTFKIGIHLNFSNITPFLFGTPEFLPPNYSRAFEYYFPAIQTGIGISYKFR